MTPTIYICNNLQFHKLENAVKYASLYFDVTGIVLAIEQSV